MPDSTLKSIVRSITPLCHDNACILRAIYMWVSKNISLDCGTARKANNSASYVLQERVATSMGFANLVSEMCRISNIRCEVVTGVAKWEAGHIGHVDDNDNRHTWNVVRVKDRWYVLDAAWGAGYCSGKEFIAEMTDAWFLTNRNLFALCHYPDEKRWQLLDTPVQRPIFLASPVIGPIASILGIFPVAGQRGILRGRADSSVQLLFVVKPQYMAERIADVAVLIKGTTTPVPWAVNGNILSVKIPFPEKGKYPVRLLVNKTHAMTFRAEVSERVRRK